MTIEEKLNLIGFKGFIHLKKEQRDNKNRKIFSSSYDNKEFDIILIKETERWTIEKINDGNLVANLLMLKNLKIDDIIFFFKNYYYKDEELSKYL